jgi:Uma2 family endonuclease
MAQTGVARATLDDLYRTPGKAELIGGRIVEYLPAGHTPSRVAFRIARSLDDHAEHVGEGVAYTDNMGFAVPELPSGRESFSPDASYHKGPLPANRMRFVEGAPIFAAEVRSENDYGPAVEQKRADKRADYFLAGTTVVWDVAPVNEVVNVYRATSPDQPTTFRRGEIADAEPAVPGWRMAVDAIFGQVRS